MFCNFICLNQLKSYHFHTLITKIGCILRKLQLINILTLVHACHNKTTIPIFHDYFKLHTLSHDHSTRQTNTFTIPKTNTRIGASSIKCNAVKVWNSNEIAKTNIDISNKSMKGNVFRHFISTYQTTEEN